MPDGAAGGVSAAGDADSGIRLAELVVALSLATDLGLGQPLEHLVRSTVLALRLGERVGLDESQRAALFHAGLLSFVGCTVEGGELADLFGDDIAFRADTYEVDLVGLPMFAFMLRHAGGGRPPAQRARAVAALLVTGSRKLERAMLAHCQVTGTLAERLGLGVEVSDPLQHAFARWDGKGLPPGIAGDRIALSARLVHLAEIAEVFHRAHGVDAAVEMARARSGRQFDPELVEEFAHAADELFEGLDDVDWPELIAAEPHLRRRLTEDELDSALEAIADFTDLRSPQFAGHARGVADLAAVTGRSLGMGAVEVVDLRRAALLQDLGRAGVPGEIWDKPGDLTASEWERVRLHAYYVERMLARPPALSRLGAIAATHHERLDGSGYHRGLSGSAIPIAGRILAAADSYRAMIEPRAYRAALAPAEAERELRSEVRKERFDADVVHAVLGAVRGRPRARRPAGPAGLTARELEVLRLVARGSRNRDVAETLVISEKTVSSHLEHIYAKLCVSTRAEAALFAMQHGLIDSD